MERSKGLRLELVDPLGAFFQGERSASDDREVRPFGSESQGSKLSICPVKQYVAVGLRWSVTN